PCFASCPLWSYSPVLASIGLLIPCRVRRASGAAGASSVARSTFLRAHSTARTIVGLRRRTNTLRSLDTPYTNKPARLLFFGALVSRPLPSVSRLSPLVFLTQSPDARWTGSTDPRRRS